MREAVPWWARIAAKLVLSRLPVGYALWRKLNLFAHGSMDRAEYAFGVFQQHFEPLQGELRPGFTALELGPGDSLASAIIAAACGAQWTYLVDSGAFATPDLGVYREMAAYLRARNLQAPDLGGVCDVDAMLQACRARYCTEGLQSLRAIPSESVDFIWSQAVLEHVRRRDFPATIAEMRRIVRADGIASHRIDLQDHLGGALNNLRIGSRVWEAEWMARSGFYTNRLRMAELLRIFDSSGFSVDVSTVNRWEKVPTPRGALAAEFRGLDDEDLLVKGFQVVLRPK